MKNALLVKQELQKEQENEEQLELESNNLHELSSSLLLCVNYIIFGDVSSFCSFYLFMNTMFLPYRTGRGAFTTVKCEG